MGAVPRDVDNSWIVLAAFQHYAVGPGESLLEQNISAYAWNIGRSFADAKAALRIALKKHWIAKFPDGPISLTAQGFSEILPN